MKVLWIGDAVIQSGFSTVTRGICKELNKECDLTVFGIGYNGKVRNTSDYYVYPGADRYDIYSVAHATDVVARDNYDVVVLFNDLAVVLDYARSIRKVMPKIPLVALFPVNVPPMLHKEVIELTNYEFCEVMTYTEFSKNHLLSINPNLSVTAVYHGVDKEMFVRNDDCKQLTGLKNNFVVGYVGSNTYRKRLDLLIEGFAKFAKDKEDVRCLLHVGDINLSYPLADVALFYGVKDKLLLSAGNIPDERVRLMYSVMDVNVNTSLGEGFGLPLLEGASCGVPILCSEHGNLTDIWSSGADFIKIDRYEYIPNTYQRGAVINTTDMAEKLSKLYEDRNYLKQKSADALVRSSELLFDWKVISDKVSKVLTTASKSRVNIIV